jgi:hypothetical protein
MEDQPPFLEAMFFGSWLADAMAEQVGGVASRRRRR